MIQLARRIQVLHGQRFLVDPAWRERLKARGIAEDLDWTSVVGDQTVSASSSATRCYRLALDGAEAVYFKRYVYRPGKWLEFWLRPGKAAVEAWAYGRLRALGIPTLEVVAFGERRLFGMLQATCIVTREVKETSELRRFATDVWHHLPPLERKRVYDEIAGQLVEQLRRAHRAGFFHHDLKWRNILIQQGGGRHVPVWIDAPRASPMHFRVRRGVIGDLSALARIAVSLLSKYDRMRFVWRYLGDGRGPGDAKRLYRAVARHLSRRPPRPLELPDRNGLRDGD